MRVCFELFLAVGRKLHQFQRVYTFYVSLMAYIRQEWTWSRNLTSVNFSVISFRQLVFDVSI